MELATESFTPLTDGDLSKVFAYSGAPATVITYLRSQSKLVKEQYVKDKEWNTLIRENNTKDFAERALDTFKTPNVRTQRRGRADVPLFSQEEVTMQDELDGVKARVYNCRSTNAWGGDLAMTVTHFPHCELSFGILFGCTNSQKKYLIQQLSLAIQDSAHPLLLPDMFAELERNRHNQIFESVISKLELMIPVSSVEGLSNQQYFGDHSDNQARRDVYLDILHLKHGLTTWSRQLKKMLEHAWTLDAEYVGKLHPVDIQMATPLHKGSETNTDLFLRDPINDEDALIYEGRSSTQSSTSHGIGRLNTGRPPKPHQATMTKANIRTIERIKTILENYSDKIRECQTRFDGLTLTTQLFQGETSVLLALAASRDSRHMRTIALVTMVFLPGTFFATIFSMTFFNWQAKDGESTVSSMFWIYIAFSVISTIATLLVYYYFVAIRTKKVLHSSV
ncbi:hypothetical protein FHL15_005351 [Xylaria flabelliformis]|uniref:Uncharacterized protein n=1 Tax=Xylaria flabelliformis TaxID=2512241 RepID=A0A553I0H0_9PEZI|nr:hypothetical protein FHL15_005351 [Xylaria flabelliformis]